MFVNWSNRLYGFIDNPEHAVIYLKSLKSTTEVVLRTFPNHALQHDNDYINGSEHYNTLKK